MHVFGASYSGCCKRALSWTGNYCESFCQDWQCLCAKLPGPFFGKITKNIENVQKNCRQKGRAKRAPLFLGQFFVLFPYFLQFFQKNGPGSFAQRILSSIRAATRRLCSVTRCAFLLAGDVEVASGMDTTASGSFSRPGLAKPASTSAQKSA